MINQDALADALLKAANESIRKLLDENERLRAELAVMELRAEAAEEELTSIRW